MVGRRALTRLVCGATALAHGSACTITTQLDDLQGGDAGAGDEGLVGHWKLDDAMGVMAVDASGFGNVGALVNGPSWTSGKLGGALDFDGIDDHLRMADSDTLGVMGDLTLAAWSRFESFSLVSPGKFPRIFQKGNDAGTTVFSLSADTDVLPPTVSMCVRIGGMEHCVGAPVELASGRWYHIVGVRAAESIRIYVDGVEWASATVPAAAIDTVAEPLVAGKSPGNSDGAVDGKMDELRVYRRALSNEEVAALGVLP